MEGTRFNFDCKGKNVTFLLPGGEDHISKMIVEGKDFYEAGMLQALAKILSAGELVVDVGANIGNHTVYFAHMLACRVIAVEAMASTHGFLVSNVRLNGVADRVELHNVALGEVPGLATIVHFDETNIGATSFAMSEQGEVPVTTLDDVVGNRSVSLIKIDVEGMDVAVLRGAAATIANSRPVIVCEARDLEALSAVHGVLGTHGYMATACYNATDTYVFFPCATDAEREALARHGFEEIIDLQREMRRVSGFSRWAHERASRGIADAARRIESLNEAISRAGDDLVRLRADAEASLHEHSEQVSVGLSQGAAAQSRLEGQLSSFKDMLQRLEGEFQQRQEERMAELHRALAAREQIEKANAQAQAKVETLSAELGQLRVEQARLADLGRSAQQRVDELTEECNLLRISLSESEGRCSDLQLESRQARADSDHLRLLLTREKTARAEAVDLAVRHEVAMRRVEQELDDALKGKITAEEAGKNATARLEQVTASHAMDVKRLREMQRKAIQTQARFEQIQSQLISAQLGSEFLRRSVSYQLGAILLAMRTPVGFLKSPVRFMRLLMSRIRRSDGEGRVRVYSPDLPDLNAAANLPDGEHRDVLRTRASAPVAAKPAPTPAPTPAVALARSSPPTVVAKPTVPVSPADQVKQASEFVVGMIADEFTFNSFKDEFKAIALEPHGWREQFEERRPDVFFCESAWSGADSKRRPWKGQVYASERFTKENRTELLNILTYCRKEGIPTAFWNKEDPTHFHDKVHDFVKTAKDFDFIFTSAAECVEGYRREHGHARVYALPFATNPRLFNPIESERRSSRIVFAGSWYANHKQRSVDMENMLDRLSGQGFEIEIHDRYFGGKDPLHAWPEKYQNFIRPGAPHEAMPAVYKSSRFGLNFNTVTDSRTMFARRVFELMSCNTLVLSNFSTGVQEMFGDLVVFPDREPHRMRSLSDEEIGRMREQALELVLRKHTYRNRWREMLDSMGVARSPDEGGVTLACRISARDDALAAIAWFQQYRCRLANARLLLLVEEQVPDIEVPRYYEEFNRFGVGVASIGRARRYSEAGRFQPIETPYFAILDPARLPADGWLEKAILHLQYAEDHLVVPASDASTRYRLAPDPGATTTVAHRSQFWRSLELFGTQTEVYHV